MSVGDQIGWSAVGELRNGAWVRSAGLDHDHVASLAEFGPRWPPILVRSGDGTIVDGHHRVAAARAIGLAQIRAESFVGTDAEAFCEAVQRNLKHGLPLRLEDRRNAAERLLSENATWSDRRIADICGLAPGTVSALRSRSATLSDKRVGRDGRARSVRPISDHMRIAETIAAHPDLSLRAIAREVGVSPETVRRVRRRLHQEEATVSGVLATARLSPQSQSAVFSSPQLLGDSGRRTLESDAALASAPHGEKFTRWFAATDISDEWESFMTDVPLSRIYVVADEARRRSRMWALFAASVEARVRRPAAALQSI